MVGVGLMCHNNMKFEASAMTLSRLNYNTDRLSDKFLDRKGLAGSTTKSTEGLSPNGQKHPATIALLKSTSCMRGRSLQLDL